MNPTLARLYAPIPVFTCKPGCTDCCGVVPWSRAEWAALPVKRRAPHDSLDCPFIKDGACGVYANRPFMCRIFGASLDPMLVCPHGCAPETPLSVEASDELTKAYRRVFGLGMVIP